MFNSKLTTIASAVLLSLGLSACGGSSDNKNTAPTAVSLSAVEITENAVAQTVGTLSATDADSNESFTYAVDDARFEISGSSLKLKADQSIDFETEQEVTVRITVTDKKDNTFSDSIVLTVTNELDSYDFLNADGESSVAYSGQIARQVLIKELFSFIGTLETTSTVLDTFEDGAALKAELMSRYAGTKDEWNESVDDTLEFTTEPEAVQTTYGSLSGSHKNLQGKIAGKDGAFDGTNRDSATQDKNWDTDLVGWNAKGSATPDGVVIALFDQLAANLDTFKAGSTRENVIGETITKLYVNEDGTNSRQLVQKFIMGAVNFSQAADDYLDDATEGKGLLAGNITGDKDGSKPYTALEHQFDEGFGYFGAARNYHEYSDDEIAGKGGRPEWQVFNDSNADGKIDLMSEYNFGHSTNAAKRDRNTADKPNPTDFTKDAFDAFLKGRHIIAQAVGGEFTTEQAAELKAEAQKAVMAWEKAIAATAVHYVNDTIADLEKLGTDGYTSDDFNDLAKHWSELKGFALSLQFNPSSPVSAEDFAMIQDKIGMKPVLTAAEVPAYKDELLEARALLAAAYEFDAENVADW
ncbi:DUF4856 domain-containing protein [Psychrobium sp. 1_MG-2023]|uniref:DUF4856 domain-containing protein n=1 Tax=Psychrobium sp. 1_MG-2023 TaxID=3062624 RepID=UPI000C34A7CB|nr:DUF4856 domain-containing protein [Psychrobium sp. 1_MG-2023]MDP2561497.1 DUF4856 domain-containing protein [Psychrobium sp. 1_MG-2023]PKF57763.1 DUF4856 domain-containing protein [Alteromonadales bacterium alter-6D02]